MISKKLIGGNVRAQVDVYNLATLRIEFEERCTISPVA
jgi:hypothetical protein